MRALLGDSSLGRAWLIMQGKTTAGYVIVIFWFDLEFGGRAALITDLLKPRQTYDAAVMRFGVERVLVPDLLRIRMRQKNEAAK